MTTATRDLEKNTRVVTGRDGRGSTVVSDFTDLCERDTWLGEECFHLASTARG